ncbi:DNA helicase [Pectobacterium phage Arno160]|uniref:DNA helicase n=1 Tax=Pectobacterium phage Arno160 TaxID=2488835 RepID=A0A3G8F264_9CAUD|nr:DNA helicase [Pectobacterium phage Arno160]AZF88078.1 DNA helicase [Pectobacterium phage Arno160]
MDKLLVATLANRSRYKALARSVPYDDVGTSTAWLIKSFGSFFEKNPEAQDVDYDVLRTMARLKLEGEDSAPVMALIKQAEAVKVTPEQIKNTSSLLMERGYASLMAMLVNRFQDGEEIDLSYEIHKETMKMRTAIGASAESMFIEPDIHEILAEQDRDEGLKFRQICLQENIKGLMPPLSIALCAGVDSGKTSFLCDALTYMAPQAEKLFPGRPIIWFSNEGVVREIWPRLYSAALGVNSKELAHMPARKLYDSYAKAIGGDRHKIKLKDAHGWTLAQVVGVIEEMNPIIVVFDMLANFKLPGVEKKHEKMEQLFQEVREIGALHKCIMFETIQFSADGYDMLYPPGTALKDTKIGAQGALDIQINMGRLNDPAYETLRGLSLPKNKRKVVGRRGTMQAEVQFNADIARFSDS